MVNTEFIEGYEGEGQVFLYYGNQEENGMLIWEGYFEYLLASCYKENFLPNGLIESYCSHSGFYDESPWEVRDLKVILDELEHFSIDNMGTNSHDTIETIIELRNNLISFFNTACIEKRKVFIEYN